MTESSAQTNRQDQRMAGDTTAYPNDEGGDEAAATTGVGDMDQERTGQVARDRADAPYDLSDEDTSTGGAKPQTDSGI